MGIETPTDLGWAPKMDGPQKRRFIMENPIKNGWFGGPIPICGNTHIVGNTSCKNLWPVLLGVDILQVQLNTTDQCSKFWFPQFTHKEGLCYLAVWWFQFSPFSRILLSPASHWCWWWFLVGAKFFETLGIGQSHVDWWIHFDAWKKNRDVYFFGGGTPAKKGAGLKVSWKSQENWRANVWRCEKGTKILLVTNLAGFFCWRDLTEILRFKLNCSLLKKMWL